nr:hypothetical protein [Mycobacterium uberis]
MPAITARDIVARMGSTPALDQCFQHDGWHDSCHVRHLAHPATTPGKIQPANFYDAIRRSFLKVLVGNPVQHCVGWIHSDKLTIVVGTAAMQLLTIQLLASGTIGLFGLAPKFTPVT